MRELSEYRAAAHSAAAVFSLLESAEARPDILEAKRRVALRRIRLYDLRKAQAQEAAEAKLDAYLNGGSADEFCSAIEHAASD